MLIKRSFMVVPFLPSVFCIDRFLVKIHANEGPKVSVLQSLSPRRQRPQRPIHGITRTFSSPSGPEGSLCIGAGHCKNEYYSDQGHPEHPWTKNGFGCGCRETSTLFQCCFVLVLSYGSILPAAATKFSFPPFALPGSWRTGQRLFDRPPLFR
jgi:hypothetical protein